MKVYGVIINWYQNISFYLTVMFITEFDGIFQLLFLPGWIFHVVFGQLHCLAVDVDLSLGTR